MNRTVFFSAQNIKTEDLNYAQESLIGEIKSRTTNQYSKGVVSPVGEYVGVDIDQTIRVYPFRAYTESGEQVYVPDDKRQLALDLTDSSNRELGTQGLLEDKDFGWESDTPYIIVAKYIEVAARPRPQYTTAKPYASRIYSGFKFYAMRENIDTLEENGINPYIILAKAIFTGGKLIVTTKDVTEYAGIDGSRVLTTVNGNYSSVYDISKSISVEQHIRSIDDPTLVSEGNPHGLSLKRLGINTNAVPEHEQTFHSAGFIGSPSSVDSCFFADIDVRNLSVDLISVYNLKSNENLHSNGLTIKSYVYPRTRVFLSLSDDGGIWPDGVYSLFINLKTRELGIASDNSSVVENRKYSLIYDQVVQGIYSPVSASSLDTSFQYLLFRFDFKREKDYTSISMGNPGIIKSNFITRTDYRVFGSISSDNLQRNSDGDFVINFPVLTTAVKFPDGTQLTSATSYPINFISPTLRLVYNGAQTFTVNSGTCKDYSNNNVLNLRSAIQKNIYSKWEKGSAKGCLPPGQTLSSGTWHVFLIGMPNGTVDVAIDKDINAKNIVNSDLSVSSPIDGFRYYRRVGSIVVGLEGQTLSIRPFITYPDGGNGITTVYNDLKNITVNPGEDGKTVLGVPEMYNSNTYCNITVKLNITNAGGATVKDHMFVTGGQAPVVVTPSHTLGVGDIDLITYDGKLTFSNTSWQGRVVSYYDPRIV